MTLWTAREAAAATGGQAQGDWSVEGVSIDTRTLQPGDLFVALKAARDGHDFVGQALEKGAGAALVSHIPEGVSAEAPLLIVSDVLRALEALGAAARARTKAKVIAITGSVGKTSTKEMMAHALQGQGKVHAAEKSYNNHWGVPLTLARMPKDTDFAVIEIGMNHPGEIAPLTAQARPHVAMVTTVGPVHLEAFEDGVPGIAREKAAIYSGLVEEGLALWNADLAVSSILSQASPGRAESFGESERADWSLTSVTSVSGALSCAAQTPMGPLLYKVGAPGRHFSLNALAVLAAVKAAGADVAQAALALASWSPPAGRGARHFVALDPAHPEVGIDLIDDSYNANPASVASGLAVLADTAPPAKGRRIAILGDMKELGPTEAALHADLAQLEAMDVIDGVCTVGPLMAHLYEALPAHKRSLHTEEASTLAKAIHKVVQPGDVVLVKGSLSMGMAQVVDAIRGLGHSKP